MLATDPLLVVLAGGLGTRLESMTEKIPKFLIEIDNQPFGKYFLDRYQSLGFKRFHFCLGHMSAQIVLFINEYQTKNPQLKISSSVDLPGQHSTLAALVNARQKGFLDPQFCLTYGDSYLLADCFEIATRLIASNKNIMTVNQNDNKGDKSNCEVSNGLVMKYSKTSSKEFNWIDYGFLILENFRLDKNIFSLENLLERLANSGDLKAEIVNEGFLEVGSHKGIENFTAYIRTLSR